MKKLIASLLLGAGLAFGGLSAIAQTAAPAADAPAATAPAAAPAAEAPAPAPAEAAAPAAAEAAAPAAPEAPKETVDKGDVTWMMISTVLVILMVVPGLALFYGGLVRSKNMLSVLMQVMVTFSLILVLWFIYGYSFAFTEGNAFIGGTDRLFMKGIWDNAAGTFANAATGYMVENLGWFKFFIWCFVLAIPGMLMLFKIAPCPKKIFSGAHTTSPPRHY